MKNYFYLVPKTLDTHVKSVNETIDKLIETTNKLINQENDRIREQEKQMLAMREWSYSVKQISEDGAISNYGDDMFVPKWFMLWKEATEPIETRDDNVQWSRPFNITNGVLYFSDFYHNSKCWNVGKLLKPGLTEETIGSLIEHNW